MKFWTFISVLANAAFLYALFTTVQEMAQLRWQNAELRIQNNRLVTDSIRTTSEINRLHELIEFYKQSNIIK